MVSQQEITNKYLKANKVMIFSKSYCPYCTRAKSLFGNTLGAQYKAIELDQMGSDGQAIQDTLTQMTGQRTVPSVWVNGQFLGGNSEVQQLHSQGKLQSMLQA
mmetsp:Transcript_10286/g.38218  ORF Transcript_10286/g.38218 Transcript_10286/m.38218 type:complete len:103 (-) Transcript_10286:406-714(-)